MNVSSCAGSAVTGVYSLQCSDPDSGASNSLLVEEYGEGGLEELVTEFHCGRYQYGLVGVNIANRGTRV